MQTITATAFSRNLSALLNQVRYQGQSFNVVRGNDSVACVSPPLASCGYPIDKLAGFLLSLPVLTDDEASSFVADVATVRQQMSDPRAKADAWGDA